MGKNTWKHACFCAFMYIFNEEAQKHACFHVFSSFRAHLYPHYIIMDKGLLEVDKYTHTCILM